MTDSAFWKARQMKSRLRSSFDYRMLVHGSSVFVPLFAEATSRLIVITGLTLVTVAYALSELLRIKGKHVPLVTSFTLRMSPQGEHGGFISKPVFLAAGIILSLIMFSGNVAYAAIVIVAVGDPTARFIGKVFGRTRLGRKSLEGFMAGWIVSLLAASVFVSPLLAMIGATTGMLLELSGILDDNLTIPIGAGSLILAATLVQSWL
jgi:phytol kinase